MIAAIILQAALTLEIGEFFPLTAGTNWTFESLQGTSKITSTEEAFPSEDVGGQPAIPKRTMIGGRIVQTIYYRTSPDTVFIIGYKADRPFADPRPILKIADKGAKWDVDTEEDGLPISLKNESSLKGRRKVLDREVDILELKSDVVVGDTQGIKEEFHQVATYGRGLGLVEMTEERRVNKNVYKRKVSLVKFTPPPEGGL